MMMDMRCTSDPAQPLSYPKENKDTVFTGGLIKFI